MNTSPKRIGLTGGIGSGKSTVARILMDRGFVVIDADAISRAVTGPMGAAMVEIAEAFGPTSVMADGAMNREHMRALVFADPTERQRLEQIVHPWIHREIEAQVALCGAPWVFLDLPLLCESGHWRERLDRVWVVDCLESTQRQRVMSRNHWSVEQVDAVMRAQCSRAQRLALADEVIDNEGVDMAELAQRVQRVIEQFGL